MTSVEYLRDFVNERLTAAAEEIFRVFKNTIIEYEDEIHRQRKLLDVVWKPDIKLRRIELPQQHVCKEEEEEEEVQADQQLCIQERNSNLDQEDPEPPQIKEEQEQLCTSQEGEQRELKQETETFMLTSTYEESDHSEDQTLDFNPDNSQSAAETELPAGMFVSWLKNESDQENPEVSEPNSTLYVNYDFDHNSDETLNASEKKSVVNTPVISSVSADHSVDQTLYFNPDNSQSAAQTELPESMCVNWLKDESDQENPEVSEPNSTLYLNHDFDHDDHNSDDTLNASEKKSVVNIPVISSVVSEPNSDHQLLSHIFYVAERQDQEGKVILQCDVCEKDFTCKSQFLRHVRMHTGEKPYACDTCGRRFTGSSQLTVHKRSHTGEKPYACDTCGKRFCRTSELSVHKRIHTGEKPYSCTTCGKVFSHSSSLYAHIKTHTGEKPHTCATCGKVFSHLSNFKSHERTHTGEKPYSCTTCGKKFRKLSSLNDHTKIHTGETRHPCTTCGKVFSCKSVLKSHIRIHTGEKPYICKTCGETFRWTSQLRTHITSHVDEQTQLQQQW